MKYLIFSCSLSEKSHSRVLAEHLKAKFDDNNLQSELIDLRKIDLPLCDGSKELKNDNVDFVKQKIDEADGIIFASPIYNYDLNSAAKNLIEHAGKAFSKKVIALAAAAGGPMSYMAPLGLLNSLMLDFRCIILPRFVYVPQSKFDDYELKDEKILERLDSLFMDFTKLTEAVRPAYN